jgi:hypothetical protein
VHDCYKTNNPANLSNLPKDLERSLNCRGKGEGYEKKTFKFHARGGSSRDEYVLHNISL